MAQDREKQRASVEKAKRRRLIQRYLHGDWSGPVWDVVNDVIIELNTERHQILEEYIRTEGDTDWVWLEENLSYQLDQSVEVEANTDEEEHAAYVAAFVLATSVIRAEHPKVRPPTWQNDELSDLRNTKVVPKDIASLARDAFLIGRDQDAIEMLRPIEEGPFIFRMSGFFEDLDIDPSRVRSRVRSSLPRDTRFEVKSTTTDDYYVAEAPDATTAIGACMLRFVHAPMQTWVVAIVTEDRDLDWNGDVIFAIGNDAAEIEDIAKTYS